jgi:hypothetical protein
MKMTPGNHLSASINPDKRRTRRHAPKGSTTAHATRNTLGLGPNIAARVLDLSEGGIRLLLREDLPRGQEFELTLESAAANHPVKVLGRVVWSVATADGQFCVGACFQKPLSYASLQALSRQ